MSRSEGFVVVVVLSVSFPTSYYVHFFIDTSTGNIGYDKAGDWAITREVGGVATDGRVAHATEVLHQIALESQHKSPKNEISAMKYIEVTVLTDCFIVVKNVFSSFLFSSSQNKNIMSYNMSL
jgi:hypothetical protein